MQQTFYIVILKSHINRNLILGKFFSDVMHVMQIMFITKVANVARLTFSTEVTWVLFIICPIFERIL